MTVTVAVRGVGLLLAENDAEMEPLPMPVIVVVFWQMRSQEPPLLTVALQLIVEFTEIVAPVALAPTWCVPGLTASAAWGRLLNAGPVRHALDWPMPQLDRTRHVTGVEGGKFT